MSRFWARTKPLVVVLASILLVCAFLVWAILAPQATQVLMVRAVTVMLVLFVAFLFFRYFVLMWFAYLGHSERNILGTRSLASLPPVSVIVPAYNEGRVLERAIASVLAQDYPEVELVVVDDGSTDDTLDRAAAWEGRHGPVTVRVVTKANGGKADALNTGIAASRHPFILCMDADSALEPQTVRRAIQHFADPSVAAVAGNVKVENRNTFLSRLQALEYIEGLNMLRRAQGFVAAVNIVPGPVGLFRREALEEVGGYETDTFAEDADLTLKLMAAGWRIEYEDEAVAWTEAPERWVDLTQQRYRWTRGILQTLRKRGGIFLRPFPDFPLWVSTLQLGFEALVWPVLNIGAHVFFALVGLLFGAGEIVLYWLVLLTLLDLVAALMTVAMEEESLALVPLAVVYRFIFVLFLDVVKAFATLEEVFGIEMGWGKLERLGADTVPEAA